MLGLMHARSQQLVSHPPIEPPQERQVLNLELTPEAYNLLKQLAEESGQNVSDVLRTGLALYGILQQEQRQGCSVVIMDQEDVIKEILLN